MKISIYIDLLDEVSKAEMEDRLADTVYIEINGDNFQNMDKIVDSVVSNMKMDIMSYVRRKYPDVWHKDSPLNLSQINELKINE